MDAEDFDGFLGRLPELLAALPQADVGGSMMPGPRRG